MSHETERPDLQEARESRTRNAEATQTAERLREGLFVPMDNKEVQAKQIVWGQLSDRELAERKIKTGPAEVDGKDGQLREFPGGVGTFRAKDGEPTLVLPPGSKYKDDGKGNYTATDANGKPIAEQRNDGTMIVHTDTGSYIETRDGKVTFVPKFKSDMPEKEKGNDNGKARKSPGGAKRAELRARAEAKRAEHRAKAAASGSTKIDVGNLDDPLGNLELEDVPAPERT